jgi:hypothetical protein
MKTGRVSDDGLVQPEVHRRSSWGSDASPTPRCLWRSRDDQLLPMYQESNGQRAQETHLSDQRLSLESSTKHVQSNLQILLLPLESVHSPLPNRKSYRSITSTVSIAVQRLILAKDNQLFFGIIMISITSKCSLSNLRDPLFLIVVPTFNTLFSLIEI